MTSRPDAQQLSREAVREIEELVGRGPIRHDVLQEQMLMIVMREQLRQRFASGPFVDLP